MSTMPMTSRVCRAPPRPSALPSTPVVKLS
jgi:hypothetical protein